MAKAKRTANGFWTVWSYTDTIRIYHETFGVCKAYEIQQAEPNKWGGTTWKKIGYKWTLREAKAIAESMIA